MIMQDNEKKPALRFKGFTDPWEQRKLGDAFERVVRKNTNNESRLPLTISAQDGLVDQITYFNNRVASRDVSNYYLVYNGEFAYNKSTSDGYPFGAVKRLDWYEKGVLSTLYIVFALKHPEKDDSDFMTVFYDTDRWHRGVAERAAEGARNHGLLNISADDFFDIDTTMPEDKVEQEKIGRLLKKLDTLITLHQRKYEKLVNIKKSMLDKMFPQNGASVPEIRFKGFTDPWEQRKFEEIAVRSSVMSDKKGLPRVEYEDIISGAGRLNKDIKLKESEKVGIVFHKGDVLYGKLRPYLQNWLLASFNGLAVGDFWVLQPQNTDSSFLYRLVQSQQFDGVANQSTGTKMPRADWKLVSKTKFAMPHSVDEQAAIGAYFEHLDTLITLHQRKLEKLQNIKKSCLEKMFV
jgi:type I restriction enzyme S subunit